MADKAYSLSNLQDIVLPEPPPLWPPAVGGWLLVLVVTGMALLMAFRLYRRYWQNRYRRAGLSLLRRAATNYDVSLLLKRVAMAAYPRHMVASLYGQDWEDFLNASCTRCTFREFSGKDYDCKAEPELIRSAARWIRYHDVSYRLRKVES